jgi:hypothetical protein
MKISARCLLFLPLFLSALHGVLGQGYDGIEGKIVNKATHEPILYANIYNQTTGKGTVSNVEGYFRIAVSGLSDTISVSFIGFRQQIIELTGGQDFYVISLEESPQLLAEATVTPEDDAYLYDLVAMCKRQSPGRRVEAKAYYELKSFKDEDQIELVEGYYNIELDGYELADLQLKAGRIALRPYQDRFFVSLESSRAILLLKLLGNNEYFPGNPLQMSKKPLKKNFYFSLEKTYLNDQADSIYILDYFPRDTSGRYFQGRMWINITKKHLEKITLNCGAALRHPFLPLFPQDRIVSVSFSITKSFTPYQEQSVFKHVDFVYRIGYNSRSGLAEEQHYTIETSAVLYAYNHGHAFSLPWFGFADPAIGEYLKINAMPYNDFFWKNNDEYRLNDSLPTNELFFSGHASLTNQGLFSSNSFTKKGFFQYPFIRWSEERIAIRETPPKQLADNKPAKFVADQYNLAMKIFVDINTYQDSTHVLTATVLDPYESFYHLPIDSHALCFLNIFFDLCELERRRLERLLQAAGGDTAQMAVVCQAFFESFEVGKKQYLKAVNRGANEKELLKYNTQVREQLGIDNASLFLRID